MFVIDSLASNRNAKTYCNNYFLQSIDDWERELEILRAEKGQK